MNYKFVLGAINSTQKKINAEINNLLKNKNKLYADIAENQITSDQLEIRKQKLEMKFLQLRTENLENELQSNIEKYKMINRRQKYSKSKREYSNLLGIDKW